MKNLVFILFAVLMLACSGTKASKDYDVSSGNFYIAYRASACFGICPEFNMKVENNGKIVFNGIKNTKLQGVNFTTITEEKLNEIITMLEKADFYNLNDKYDEKITDLPFVSVELMINGKKKIVTFRMNPPEGLDKLVDYFNSLIDNTSLWTKESK